MAFDPKHNSRTITGGRSRSRPPRALVPAGFTREDMGKSSIGIANTLRSAIMTRTVAVFACSVSIIFLGCGSYLDGDGDNGPEPYQTPIAAAARSGVPAFWLGEEIDLITVTLDTIEAKYTEGSGAEVGALGIVYFPEEEAAPGRLKLSIISRSQWPLVQDDIRQTGSPSATRRTLQLGKWNAELVTISAVAGRVNGHYLIVEADEWIVLAQTNAAYGEDGRELNPLIDEELFLRVMQKLRPYPD